MTVHEMSNSILINHKSIAFQLVPYLVIMHVIVSGLHCVLRHSDVGPFFWAFLGT